MNNSEKTITLKDLFDVFVAKIVWILLVGLLCGALAYVYSSFIKQTTYTATATVYVYNNSTGGTTTSDITIAKSMVETYTVIMEKDHYLSEVIRSLPENYRDGLTVAALRDMIGFSQNGKTEVFDIHATTDDPAFSVAIVKAMAGNTKTTLVDLLPDNTSVSVSIIDEPQDAGAILPDTKHTLRNTILGLLIGMVLSFVVFFVMSLFDIIVHDRKRLEDTFPDIPVLGVLPRYENEIPDFKKGDA